MENKTAKYLKYAIGEILLVMIGILLALQVNNWNDNRRIRESEHKSIMDLRKEFIVNKLKLEFIFEKAGQNRNEMLKYLEFLRNTGYFQSPEFGMDQLGENYSSPGGLKTYNPVNGVIGSLINSGQINNIQNDSLKYLLSSWSELANDFKENNEGYLNWYNTSFLNYKRNLPPLEKENYSALGLSEEWIIKEYVKTFSDFKYWSLIKEAEYQLNSKEAAAEELLNFINRILELLDKEILMLKK